MCVYLETASVDSRVGRRSMWCLMEPKYPSMSQSPEKVSTLIPGFVIVVIMSFIFYFYK